jgi:hypothetical protein
MSTTAGNKPLIAVVGATGQQGGAVVHALQGGGQFRVPALKVFFGTAPRSRSLGDALTLPVEGVTPGW